MRLPGSEKLEIIRLVEQSHLPARRTLEMLGIRPSTFYRWYDRYRSGGPEALEDRPSKPDRVWNRIPDDVRQRIVAMALDVPELSRQIEPAPADHLQVGEVGLPELVGGGGLVFELVVGPHGRAELPGDDVAREVVEAGC